LAFLSPKAYSIPDRQSTVSENEARNPRIGLSGFSGLFRFSGSEAEKPDQHTSGIRDIQKR
jgi:hypothetical protein